MIIGSGITEFDKFLIIWTFSFLKLSCIKQEELNSAYEYKNSLLSPNAQQKEKISISVEFVFKSKKLKQYK